MDRLTDAGLIVLTLARWLLPTEATAEGETLWIAGLWFVCGALFGVVCWRTGRRRRWDAADLAVGLFVGGHVISGVMVLATQGDHRAAANLLWEWLSLGLLWIVWRGRLDSPQLRQSLTLVLLATAVTLSVWGLWQHFVWYPQLRAEYGPVFDQLRQKMAAGVDAAAERKKLSDAGIPTDGPSLQLFENRLRNSQEPFGPFGLANTFGGLLAAWLIVGLGVTLKDVGLAGWHVPESSTGVAIEEKHARRKIPPMASAGFVVAAILLPIAVCLYLTNSRTAWGGMFAALGAGGVLLASRRSASATVRRMLFPASVLAACLFAAATLAWIMTGEHDLPGPLKSLAYRAEYWIGTWRLLMTTPWQGVGLGQFRDRYLPYRLPVSSEEIADPHNLLLDVWANGGLIALLGLLGLIGILLIRLWHLHSPPTASTGSPPRSIAHLPILLGLAAFGVVILGQLISTGLWDNHADLLMIFAVVWGGIAWCLSRIAATDGSVLAWAGPLAALALTVHLLGAGGIAMPAVTELWLLLIAVGLPAVVMESEPPRSSPFRGLPLVGSLLSLAFLAGWFFTGWRPTTQAKQLLAEGDYQFSRTGDADRAERYYRQAAAADHWSAEPWQRLAEAEFSRAVSGQAHPDPQRLDEALRDQQEAIQRSPFRFQGFLRKAEMLAAMARSSQHRSDWNECLAAYHEAEQKHPTLVNLLADFALVLDEADQPDAAAEVARKALRQDELNHQRGHTERFLPEELVRRLKGL